MNSDQIYDYLKEGIAELPLIDVHTHLDAAHLAARGLHDVLLYHMVISDLVSAGCPSRARLSEEPEDANVKSRLLEAIPYIRHIQNTSIFWGMRIILRDLYEWNEPITLENWQQLDAIIRERNTDPEWPRTILKKARISRAGTELWRGREGSANDIFQYALEWAFFTRAQWGVNDTPLYELEYAWNQAGPSAPLPVTLGDARPQVERSIHRVEDVKEAIAWYVSKIPYGKVLSTAQHISTDINFHNVSDLKMNEAIANRSQATSADRDTYASFILEVFLCELEKHSDEIVYQFSFGAEPLPYETGSKLRQETIYELAAIIDRHPRLRFQVFLSSEHTNQSLCTLSRELPNLSLSGYWWHNFFPGSIRKILSERLDMVATNKQIGFFSDAYCVDWAYSKAQIVRKQMVEVLTQKVVMGQYTCDEALAIARQICYVTPQTLLGFIPGEF